MNVRNEAMPKMATGLGRDEKEQRVEITPEMIEAGASVLYRMELAFAREEFWAGEVYRAMASLAPAACVLAVSTLVSARGAPSS